MIRMDVHWWTCMIGGGAIVFALLFLTGCTAGYGNGYAFASVGGDAERVSASAGSLTITGMNNSKAFEGAQGLAGQVVTAGVIKAGLEAAPKVIRSTGDAVRRIAP